MASLTYLLRMHYLVAACAGFIAGLAVNYKLSACWVFTHRRGLPVTAELLVFGGVGLVGLGVTELMLYALSGGLQMPLAFSKVAAAGVVFVWNFCARRLLLFTADD